MRIKKTSNTRAIAGKVLNVASESTTDAYSCDYINDCNTYSTSEVNTGKTWIDSKPIYRKVIVTTAGEIRNNDSKLNLAVSSIVNLYGFLSRSNYGYMPFNNTFTPTTGSAGFNCALYYSPNNNRIEGSIDTAFADNREAIIIVEYTKTTD